MKLKLPHFPAEHLEKALNSVESGEDMTHFIEGTDKISHGVLSVASVFEKFLPPLKIALSGLLMLYLGYKYIKKFRTKPPTTIRILGATINLGVAISMLAFAIAILFAPALLPVFTLVIITLGVAREGFNLGKTANSQFQSRGTLQNLSEQLEKGEGEYKEGDFKTLMDQHQTLALKHVARQWKMAHLSVDLAIGLLSIAAVVIVITTGPFGWIALGAIAVAGIAVKLGMSAVKKYRLQKAAQFDIAEVKPVEKEDVVLSHDEHIHSDAEIIKEMKEHPHDPAHVHKDVYKEEITESQAEQLAKKESELFEDESLKTELKPKPDNKAAVKKEKDEEEGEGEGEGGPQL